MQQRLEVTCAAFFLAQLLNQRGQELPGQQMFVELSAQAVSTERLAAHGLHHEQIHALQELEASARAARDPLGPKRPQPKRGPRLLRVGKRSRYDDGPGGETPGPGGSAPSEPTVPTAGRQAPTAESHTKGDTTLRPLLPERLADKLPQGGIADVPLQCLEAPLRTQLIICLPNGRRCTFSTKCLNPKACCTTVCGTPLSGATQKVFLMTCSGGCFDTLTERSPAPPSPPLRWSMV